MTRKWQTMTLASVVLLLLMSSTMWASTNLGLQLSSTPDTATCEYNTPAPGCGYPMPGEITFSGPVGQWSTNGVFAFGPPYEMLVPLLDVTSFNATTGGNAPVLTILLSVSGVTSFQGVLAAIDSIGGTNNNPGTTITTQGWLSAANTQFCASTSCGGVAITPLLSVTGRNYNGTAVGSYNFPNSPFAITLAITIDSHGAADQTSFDNEFDIPEPASLSLLGSGLLGFGMMFRRKLAGG